MPQADSALDAVISKLEKHLAAARQLKEALDRDPELAEMLARELVGRPPNTAVPSENERNGKSQGTTAYGRIRQFFLARENAWSTTAEIMKETGLARGATANVIYTSKPKEFEAKQHPDKPTQKQFRLRNPNEGGGSLFQG
ncbi:MAG: hypothetical protein AMXMBFR13_16080 [Phycisphaerae bacterium]